MSDIERLASLDKALGSLQGDTPQPIAEEFITQWPMLPCNFRNILISKHQALINGYYGLPAIGQTIIRCMLS